MIPMNNEQANRLLAWYQNAKRALPWREEPTPYHVWLSEIMLQQTRVEAVKSYYERFLHAFPSIETLAEAEEEKVLKLWEGLGYYSRARNLHKGAKAIISSFRGNLPCEPASLSQIPGIGEYTRNAILAIAFQKPFIAVDGNLMRLYARLEAKRFSAITPTLKKEAEAFFAEAFPLNRPGDFNQALMDLGELICLPNGKPLCEGCPCASFCQAHRLENEESYPGKRTKKEKKSRDVDVFLMEKDGKIAIEKRGEHGLLAGLYQFPNIEKRTTKGERTEWLKKRGLHPKEEKPIGGSKHIFTHIVWNMEGYRIKVEGEAPNLLFLSPQEIKGKYSIPSAFRFYLKQID